MPAKTRQIIQRMATLLLAILTIAACQRSATHSQAPVRLRFWHAWGGYEGKAIQDLVNEFNRTHPGIIVEASQFTIGDKLLASIAGGKPPDIATVWSYMLTPMGESGAFLPLNDYMTSSGYTRESYLPNVWEYGLYGDKRWGVPTTLNVIAIYYLTEAVRQAGLDPARPPKTTAELARWSQLLTQRSPEKGTTRLGLVPVQHDTWLRAFGGSVFDEQTRTFTLDSAENLAALNWMKQQVDFAGGMANYRRFTAQFGKLDSPANPLLTGKLAMKEDGQWVIRFFEKFAPRVDYGLLAFPPKSSGDPEVAKLDGSFWSIPVGTKHPDEAWTFISWMIAPEQNARLCAAFLNIPPMRATTEIPEFKQARQNPKFEFFVRLLLDGKAVPQPATPVSEQLYDKLEDGVQRVYSGSIPPAQMLQELEADLNAELERTSILLGVDVGP
jgi:multiple sugar transport system substrate-binding protein